DESEVLGTMAPLGWDEAQEPLSGEGKITWGEWCLVYQRLLQGLSAADLAQMGDRLVQWNSLVSLVRPNIEALWEPIMERDDWSVFEDVVQRIWDQR
ncbi:MAG: protein adenylyltransferase SelO family protein, partial [Cyanobacteria bacterium P01_H01_bin.130]